MQGHYSHENITIDKGETRSEGQHVNIELEESSHVKRCQVKFGLSHPANSLVCDDRYNEDL